MEPQLRFRDYAREKIGRKDPEIIQGMALETFKE